MAGSKIWAPRALARRQFLAASLLASGVGLASCTRRTGRERRATLWFSYGGQNRLVLERLIDRFNQTSVTGRIHGVFQGDYYEAIAKLRLGIAAGEVPTITHVIGEVVPYLVEAGVLQRLDAFPGATDIDTIEALSQRGSFVYPRDKLARQHELYALPFNRSTPIAYVNQNLFDALDVEIPSTWDDLRSVARRFAEVRPGKVRYGFGSPIDWWFWLALLGQAGGEVVDADGQITLGGKLGVEAVEFWQTLVNRDRTMKPPPGRDANAMEITNRDFLSERIPMMWTSTAFLNYLEENAAFDVRAVALPRHRRYATPTGGTHFVMLRDTPDWQKEIAWRFLVWMMQPDQVIEWSTSTGYMPTTATAVERLRERGFYRQHPNYLVAYDQLDVASALPWSQELFRVQREVIQPRLEQAVLEDLQAGDVMRRALVEARTG